MKQKIEWYREVLELEPGSRVFFPLAKLFSADNQIPEAVATLRQGILRHPDHLEARLLLIELLYTRGERDGVAELVDALTGLLRQYPHFWQAWSEKLSLSPSMRDAALSLRFFAAALSGKNINWGAVIESGLTNLLDHDDLREAPKTVPAPPAARGVTPAQSSEKTGPLQASNEKDLPRLALDEDLDAAEEEADEPFSLRTRTMAEVLAEQGDNAGALEIYKELAANASTEDRPAIEARMAELSAKAAHSQEPGSKPDDVEPDPDKNRVVELLESLARRLEERAQ